MRIYNVPLAGKITPVVTSNTGSITGISGVRTKEGGPMVTVQDTGHQWTTTDLKDQQFVTRHVYVIENDYVGEEGFQLRKANDKCWYIGHLANNTDMEAALANGGSDFIGLPEIKETSSVRVLGFIHLDGERNTSALVLVEELVQDRTGIIEGIGSPDEVLPNVETQFMNIQ